MPPPAGAARRVAPLPAGPGACDASSCCTSSGVEPQHLRRRSDVPLGAERGVGHGEHAVPLADVDLDLAFIPGRSSAARFSIRTSTGNMVTFCSVTACGSILSTVPSNGRLG